MEDLVINNGRVVIPSGTIYGGVAATEGKITYIGSDRSLPTAKAKVNAEGNYVIPGHIDPHTHLGAGATSVDVSEEKFRSDWETESASAAIGGITTIISTVPFGDRTARRLEAFKKAKKIVSGNSFTDFKFNALVNSEVHLDEFQDYIREGINSFKFSMGYRGAEAKQIGSAAIDWAFVYRAFESIASFGPPSFPMIHAEEPEIISVLQERFKSEGRTDLVAWTDSRPGICEAIHAFTVGLIANHLGVPIYIVHISAKETIDTIEFLRSKGIKIYAETCPHYLVLTKHANAGLLAKVNPPVRTEQDNERIWQAISNGTIDNIGSDHVCYQRWQKEREGIWQSLPGFGNFGATLALLLSEGLNKGRINIERLTKLTAENTARIYGIYPQKGVLAPGSDADILIVDPAKTWRLGVDTLKSASDFSIYDGMQVKGRVMKTFIRGKLVAEDGRLMAKAPLGEYIYSHQ